MTYNGVNDDLGPLDKVALRHLYGRSIDKADLRFKELPDGLRIKGDIGNSFTLCGSLCNSFMKS